VSDASDRRTSPRPTGGGRPRPRWALLATVAVSVLALDQLTKWWAVNELDTRIVDIVGSLRLRLTYNYGAAFSTSQGRGAVISLLAVVVVGVLVFSGRQATRPLAALALGMVLGGAIGNLTDRALRDGHGFLGGGVVDFIDLQWWPIFNVADSAVVCGALLLVAASWREEDAPRGADDGSRGAGDARGRGAGAGADAGGTASGVADDDDDGDDGGGGGNGDRRDRIEGDVADDRIEHDVARAEAAGATGPERR
jgi:signal peptidase II